MIMGHRQKLYQRPPPGYEFDKFLKIRSQKQSIIQSQSQPITQKVQGFQQLLKLTKTGTSISALNVHKRHQNSQLKNKTQSSKTLNCVPTYNNNYFNNQSEPNRFQNIETDQTQLKKLNKMVWGLSEWEYDKEKQSLHLQRKPNTAKFSTQKRHKKINSKPLLEQADCKDRKQLAYTASEGKKFRKFYTPLKKHQAMSELNRINSEFIKTSAKINYPQTLLAKNILEDNKDHFKDLKNKIKLLQTRAKNQYGLKFDHPNMIKTKGKEKYIWDESKDNSEEKQNEDFDFSDLQLGPILAKQLPLKYKQYQKSIDQEQTKQNDPSVPKSLIDIVQNKRSSYHQFALASRKIDTAQCYKRNKMKKSYLARPKTFKPTYTYIKI